MAEAEWGDLADRQDMLELLAVLARQGEYEPPSVQLAGMLYDGE